MKKNIKKLQLSRETLRDLRKPELDQADGGWPGFHQTCWPDTGCPTDPQVDCG